MSPCVSVLKPLLLIAGVFSISSAFATPWNLPAQLSDLNTKVRFEVDSTWHLVEGATSHLEGKAWLATENDYESVNVELELPVIAFDTDNKSRNEKLRKVMESDSFPLVKIRTDKTANLCDPVVLKVGESCNGSLSGTITIRDVTKKVELPVIVTANGESYQIKGNSDIQWAEYGVADPSIFVARVAPVAKVFFEVELAK